MLQITVEQTIVHHVNTIMMRGPKNGVEQAKAHMLSRLVKGIPATVQVDMVINDSLAYTLEIYSVTP